KNSFVCSQRLIFKMDKENVFDDESDSEGEEKIMLNLPDSDVDEIEDQLNGIGLNDDDAYLPHEMNKVMLNKSKFEVRF
ncbi:unnamed protein product, partial [Rotaria socialis]